MQNGWSRSQPAAKMPWRRIGRGHSVERPASSGRAGGTLAASISRFDGQHLFKPALEALFVGDEPGADEGVDQLEGELGADDPRAQHQHVHVVVLDPLVGGVGVVAHAGAYAGNLVGGHADAYARAADENAAGRIAAPDGVADQLGEVGIVGGLGVECAHVDNFVAGGGEVVAHFVLQRETGMIGSDDKLHGSSSATQGTGSREQRTGKRYDPICLFALARCFLSVPRSLSLISL